jgi:adenylate cyclase
MASIPPKSLVRRLLVQQYQAVAILVILIVWLAMALALRPLRDADGSYASSPYGLSSGVENKALDLLFQIRNVLRPAGRTRGLSEPITIVEIDERAIRASQVRLQKWPRDWYARLIDRASQGGASVIGLDVFLSEKGGASEQDAESDRQLSTAISEAGNVVIASKLAAGGSEAIIPLPMFSEPAYATGFVDMPRDSDQFIRSSQLVRSRSGKEEYSFATRVAEGFLAAKASQGGNPEYLMPINGESVRLGERTLPLRNDGNLQLDFRAPPQAFQHISAADILFTNASQISDDLFRDRIVLIGAANVDAPDRFSTPFYEATDLVRFLDRSLPSGPVHTTGVELHATVAATMLFGQSPTRPDYLLQVLALMLPFALVGAAVFRLRILWALTSLLFIAIASLILSSWAFNAKGLILPLATAWCGIAILTPLGLGLRYARERIMHEETESERASIKDILSRCVSEEVADELWQHRDQIMTGERRIVSIIFSDIRGFTTLSESSSSDQVVVWLNDYFTRMQAIVTRHCGHINKFLGDGLMIVFGAPISRGDEAEARAAVACGLEMLAAVERMNLEWQGSNRPEIKIGVGITTGEATCGVVGAERRLEYTVIGDVVNLAARLEATTKEYGISLIVSEATVRLLDDYYEARNLGEVKVKGRNEFSKIFTVRMGKPSTKIHEEPRTRVTQFLE